MRYQSSCKTLGDCTGANDINLGCRDKWGWKEVDNPVSWHEWTQPIACPDGFVICGLKTRVQAKQGLYDDTALNGVEFKCCYNFWAGCKLDTLEACKFAALADTTLKLGSKNTEASMVGNFTAKGCFTYEWNLKRNQGKNGVRDNVFFGTSKDGDTGKLKLPMKRLKCPTGNAQCPDGYFSTKFNIGGKGMVKSFHVKGMEKCAKLCDDRSGCTGYEWNHSGTSSFGCYTYTAGAKNVETKTQSSSWTTCIKNLPGSCVIETADACRSAAKAQGLKVGSSFKGSYDTKGCYAYADGKWKGQAYFGTGGWKSSKINVLTLPKYRLDCRSKYQLPKYKAPKKKIKVKQKKVDWSGAGYAAGRI